MNDGEQCLCHQTEWRGVGGGPSAPQMTAGGQEPQEGYIRCVYDASSWEGVLLSPTGQQLEKGTCSLFFLS